MNDDSICRCSHTKSYHMTYSKPRPCDFDGECPAGCTEFEPATEYRSRDDLQARLDAIAGLAEEMGRRSLDLSREYPLRTVWQDCADGIRAVLSR